MRNSWWHLLQWGTVEDTYCSEEQLRIFSAMRNSWRHLLQWGTVEVTYYNEERWTLTAGRNSWGHLLQWGTVEDHVPFSRQARVSVPKRKYPSSQLKTRKLNIKLTKLFEDPYILSKCSINRYLTKLHTLLTGRKHLIYFTDYIPPGRLDTEKKKIFRYNPVNIFKM